MAQASKNSGEFLTPSEVSIRLKLKVATLNVYRAIGRGPLYTHDERGRVHYLAEDVERWDQCRQRERLPQPKKPLRSIPMSARIRHFQEELAAAEQRVNERLAKARAERVQRSASASPSR